MKTLFKRIDEMNKDVRELRMFMHRGKGAGAVAFVILSLIGSFFYFFKN